MQRAFAVFGSSAEERLEQVRGSMLVQGTIAVDAERLATILAGDRRGHATVRVLASEVLVGGRLATDDYSCWVSEYTYARDANHLRAVDGKRCWFCVAPKEGILGQCLGIFPSSNTQDELAAVRMLMSTPLATLAQSVARENAAVERAVSDLRARRTKCDEALDQLGAWDEALLPGLLFAMMRSLEHRHDGEALIDQGHGHIAGYNTPTACVFDLLCFASVALRGDQRQACTDDDARAAEVRGLACWLHFRALGMTPRNAPRRLRWDQ